MQYHAPSRIMEGNVMPLSLTIRRMLSTQPVELPVFNPIAVKLQQLLEMSAFTLDQVLTLINEDQSLAGQILRMANSVGYIGRVRVETIKDAVIRMGAQHVSNIAMATSQSGLHCSDSEVFKLFMQKLWSHSHACAMGARWVAFNANLASVAEQAYMAGLLHDVGKLYLLKALERLNRAGVAHAALEEEMLLEIFAELHVEQGLRIMQHWNMPEIYCKAVAGHHAEPYDSEDLILTIVRLVNAACKVRGISVTPDPTIDILRLPEARQLGLTTQMQLAELEVVIEDSLEIKIE